MQPTVKDIITELADFDSTENKPIQWFISKGDRRAFLVMIVAAAAAVCTAIASNFVWRPELRLTSTILVVVMQVAFMVQQGIVIVHGARLVRRPMKALLTSTADDKQREYILAGNLSRAAEHDLRFVHDQLKLAVKHFYSRIKVIFGAIEQVGIIPSMVAVTLAFKEELSSGLSPPWFWAAVFLMGMHVLSMYLVDVVQRMEKKVLLIETAIALNRVGRIETR